MLFGYLTLFTALIISLSAAVYSILGLTAIFAAAFWPIVIMGGSLEVGKIVTTLWLHKYWDRAEIQYKLYLCSAVAVLMFLTSMGVFGFLSKAHSDQSLVSGDSGAKVAIYDEKIKTERDNVEVNRKALRQMDEAVDQVMARSTTEGGADKAVAIRRSQQKERGRLQAEIVDSQKKISSLSEERAPLAAENRKIEAEVGPIKYIAAMVYGDNPDANVLERAVRWVIILIVVVFDPLALTLLLAATKALEWERGINIFVPKKKDEEDLADNILRKGGTNSNTIDNIPLTDNLEPVFDREEIPIEELFPKPKNKRFESIGWMFNPIKKANTIIEPVEEDAPIDEDHPDFEEHLDPAEKAAQRAWKIANPDETIKKHRTLHRAGLIDQLPWHHPDYQDQLKLEADNVPAGVKGEVRGFGNQFPDHAVKGDMFLRVDQLPSVLYKFNGNLWIEVDKSLSDQHTYDEAYIDHLIEKISTGEYDPELLSDAERDSIERRLHNNTSI